MIEEAIQLRPVSSRPGDLLCEDPAARGRVQLVALLAQIPATPRGPRVPPFGATVINSGLPRSFVGRERADANLHDKLILACRPGLWHARFVLLQRMGHHHVATG